MKITEVNSYKDFLSLKEDWNKVLRDSDHTIFSTWEWLSTWWKYFGKDRRLLILLAEESGQIIGIAPLMYSVYTMFGLRRGKIEFIGTPDSDYLNFILVEKKEACIKLFVDYLYRTREKWDVIDLHEIPENAEYLPFISKISSKVIKIHRCPYIPLPHNADDLLKKFGSKARHDLRRKFKKAEADFKTNWVDYSSEQSLNIGMPIFLKLHQKRWSSKGFSGVFAEERLRNFHLDVAKSFSQNGWLGLYVLEFSGKPVSAIYGFKYQSKFYYYLSGFDPAYYRYSVGILLQAYVMTKCIEEGLSEFDFMRGAEGYKDRWTKTSRWNYEAFLVKDGAIPRIQHCLYNLCWQQGNRLKYFLRQ